MGSIISQICEFFQKFWQLIFEAKEKRLLFVGLDAAGKTTILYQLTLGEVVSTEPTGGFNCELFRYSGVSFRLWDVGGRSIYRSMWRHYYSGTDGLIFVVDSNDRERMEEVSSELYKTLASEDLKNVPLLILANKQDLAEAIMVPEIVEKLNLHSLKDREWLIQGACALTGKGLREGLDWFKSIFREQRKKQFLESCCRGH